MSRSEAHTRKEIIDQRLLKAGWNINDPSQVTEELDIIADSWRAEDPEEKYSASESKLSSGLFKNKNPLAGVPLRQPADRPSLSFKDASESIQPGCAWLFLFSMPLLKASFHRVL